MSKLSLSILRDLEALLSASQIGGFMCAGNVSTWFSEQFHVQDFVDLGIPVGSDAARDICCYEIALLHVFSIAQVGGRMRVCVPSWCDNTGAEAKLLGSNELSAGWARQGFASCQPGRPGECPSGFLPGVRVSSGERPGGVTRKALRVVG